MAQVFKDIQISVGFNVHQTTISLPNAVISENDAVRFIITFPDIYSDYVKGMDISYSKCVRGKEHKANCQQYYELSYPKNERFPYAPCPPVS